MRNKKFYPPERYDRVKRLSKIRIKYEEDKPLVIDGKININLTINILDFKSFKTKFTIGISKKVKDIYDLIFESVIK